MSLVFAVDSKRALPELCQQSSKNVEKCYRRFSNSRLTGDAALFLFDQTVAEYLTWIFSTAVGRRTVRVVQSEPDHSASLPEEETKLAVWYSEQYEEIRAGFVRFSSWDRKIDTEDAEGSQPVVLFPGAGVWKSRRG